MIYDNRPYWKIHNLSEPQHKGGFPRVKIKFDKGRDGWLDIDYQEFMHRVERLKLDVPKESTRLLQGYEIRLGYGTCLLAELVEQQEARRQGSQETAQKVSSSSVEPVRFKQLSFY